MISNVIGGIRYRVILAGIVSTDLFELHRNPTLTERIYQV